MSQRALNSIEDKVVLSKPLGFLLPTLTTLYFNRRFLADELKTVRLPNEEWARREARALLSSSEARLGSIEAKGPGLAAASAVVGAAVLLALSAGWDTTTRLGKVVLVAATVYAAFSLAMPIYLVGPQPRHTLDTSH